MEHKSLEVDAVSNLAEAVQSFIKNVGFPVFIALMLIYNQWQLQSFLMVTNEKRDTQLATLTDAVRTMSIVLTQLQGTANENKAMLTEQKYKSR